MLRHIALAGSSVLIGLAPPSAASAATIESTASIGPASETYLVFVAGKGERNHLTIADSRKGIVFSDPGARMRRFKGLDDCRYSRDRHRATCSVLRRTTIYASLRDRNDTLRFKGLNAGRLGPTARNGVDDAATLADEYLELEGAIPDHTYLSGGSGNDVVLGTDRRDVLNGGSGRDIVDGGAGPDRIVDGPDGAPDELRGGKGVDTVDGAGRSMMTIDLRANVLVAARETDELDSFERARGGAGEDTLLGSSAADGLFGDHGSDNIDGRGGGDYLGGDLEVQDATDGGTPGPDVLTGGPGDDVLDGRDSGEQHRLTPTDELICDEGSDRIVALQDDLADPSCEYTATGVFSGDLVFDQQVNFDLPLTAVNPVARGNDGAPTYSIGCSGADSSQNICHGEVRLERPPVTGMETEPEVLGQAGFDVAGGRSKDVTVVLNDAGRAALAEQDARVSVHLLGDAGATVGWQQVLGP